MRPLNLTLSVATITALTALLPLATAQSVVVITVAPPQPTTEPTYVSDSEFQSQCLNSTNLYRYEHNATAIAWNSSLASYAANWTSDCVYAHSVTSSGENIAQGFTNLSLAIDAWGNERAEYNFDDPGYAEATGHFTQLVWKATRTMGCGRKYCGAQQGWFLSCNYWPVGNVILNGKFEAEEVQSQVNSGQGYSYANGSEGINSGDAGVGNYTAPAGTTTTASSASASPTSLGTRLVGSGVVWRAALVVVVATVMWAI